MNQYYQVKNIITFFLKSNPIYIDAFLQGRPDKVSKSSKNLTLNTSSSKKVKCKCSQDGFIFKIWINFNFVLFCQTKQTFENFINLNILLISDILPAQWAMVINIKPYRHTIWVKISSSLWFLEKRYMI